MFATTVGWHALLLSFFLIVPLILWIICLVQIAGSKAAAGLVVAWVAIATLLPWVGAILWFTIGRKSLRAQPQATV